MQTKWNKEDFAGQSGRGRNKENQHLPSHGHNHANSGGSSCFGCAFRQAHPASLNSEGIIDVESLPSRSIQEIRMLKLN
jgi:hypothetical protein